MTKDCNEFDNAGAMMSVDETLMCSFQVCFKETEQSITNEINSQTKLIPLLLLPFFFKILLSNPSLTLSITLCYFDPDLETRYQEAKILLLENDKKSERKFLNQFKRT